MKRLVLPLLISMLSVPSLADTVVGEGCSLAVFAADHVSSVSLCENSSKELYDSVIGTYTGSNGEPMEIHYVETTLQRSGDIPEVYQYALNTETMEKVPLIDKSSALYSPYYLSSTAGWVTAKGEVLIETSINGDNTYHIQEGVKAYVEDGKLMVMPDPASSIKFNVTQEGDVIHVKALNTNDESLSGSGAVKSCNEVVPSYNAVKITDSEGTTYNDVWRFCQTIKSKY